MDSKSVEVIRTEQYALLGTYEHGNRNNIEIIATADDYGELVNIREVIKGINSQLIGKDRDAPNDEVDKLIEEYLASVDIVDEITGYVHDITVYGIFKIDEMDIRITKVCTKCGKVLFKGTESEARHLIIYCGDCPMDKELKS